MKIKTHIARQSAMVFFCGKCTKTSSTLSS